MHGLADIEFQQDRACLYGFGYVRFSDVAAETLGSTQDASAAAAAWF
jgi:hypothetical protein